MPDKLPLLIGIKTKVKLMMLARLAPGTVGVIVKVWPSCKTELNMKHR